jgi:hypothetical protein
MRYFLLLLLFSHVLRSGVLYVGFLSCRSSPPTIAKSKASEICPKRVVSHISQGADDLPLREPEQVKLSKRGKCVCCLQLRFTDRPKKRVALGQIASKQGRESISRDSWYGCKQCDVYLCKICSFDAFHKGR